MRILNHHIGIHAAVFAQCLYHIWPRSVKRGTKNNWFLITFIWILFVMGTINFACNTRMTQLMFIDNRAFPGGPMAWFMTNYGNGVNTAGNAGYIIANFLADALLVSSSSSCLASSSLKLCTALALLRRVECCVDYHFASPGLHGLDGCVPLVVT